MTIDFKFKDVMHRITALFVPAYLPDAKKKYNLHAKHQPELDIHGIASKAELYDIATSPKVIEEGLTAGMELLSYLAADGYKIKTPVFTLKAAFPGEYDGSETHLPEGVLAQARLNVAPELQKFFGQSVRPDIIGVEENTGFITEVINKVTGEVDLTVRPNSLFEIRGVGLKVAADAKHADDIGIYFEHATTGTRVKVNPLDVDVNTPRSLHLIAPRVSDIPVGESYYVVVRTQASITRGNTLLKEVREMKSDFTITSA
ncbi:MAG: DUF4469 domain-containing protein [Prevotellaceae bacterium]|jgi:hypothetical protein|nr:DUF4469 domain-containing protein [Prevotellaceae bacterium]